MRGIGGVYRGCSGGYSDGLDRVAAAEVTCPVG